MDLSCSTSFPTMVQSSFASASWFGNTRSRAFLSTTKLSGAMIESQKPQRGRVLICMCKGIPAEEEAFFKSSIVQNEMNVLQADYKNLLQLGRKFGQFDRQGKKSYICEMRALIERWKIFHKRMELSDDFTAKLCAKQLKTSGGPFDLSNYDLVHSLYVALDEMEKEADFDL